MTRRPMKVTFWTLDGLWYERKLNPASSPSSHQVAMLMEGQPFQVYDPRVEANVYLVPTAVRTYRIEEDEDAEA